MTFKYDNVYINDSSTVAGPYEKMDLLEIYMIKLIKNFILMKNI